MFTLKDIFRIICYGGLDMYLVGASVYVPGFVLIPCNLKYSHLCACSTPILPSSYGPLKVNKKNHPKQIEHKSKDQQKNPHPLTKKP